MDNFNTLPTEIILDILIRLPVESVLNCKLISNTWKNHIHHPSFGKMHASCHLNHNADDYALKFITPKEEEKHRHTSEGARCNHVCARGFMFDR
ncbi:putative F-box protein At1g33020 isoform X2 [Papaver somniferum]|nr:putative F-box protein At1g33020 isoform X2 [Papaver somniferum]